MTRRPRIHRVHRYDWRNGTEATEGIVLHSGNRIVAHLTPSEAYKLANRIVDTAEKLEMEQSK